MGAGRQRFWAFVIGDAGKESGTHGRRSEKNEIPKHMDSSGTI